jgi:hypothetical protein
MRQFGVDVARESTAPAAAKDGQRGGLLEAFQVLQWSRRSRT